MRIIRRLILVLSALLVMLTGGALPAQVTPSALANAAGHEQFFPGDERCPTRDRVADTNTYVPPPLQEYYLDDWRFGPKRLPAGAPLGPIIGDYERFGGQSPARFLACYWNSDTNGWWYPAEDGFVLDEGRPVTRPVTLEAGQKLDLFGSGLGRFLAPAGSPYEKRAIPPSNLDTSDPNYPYGYHLYEVLRPFTVEAGPVRPWFGQPGHALQYVLNSAYLPGAPADARIPYLVQNGYLRPLN